MSKSVLIIDTPKECNVLCPCYSSDLVGRYCNAVRDDKGWCRPARKISNYNETNTKPLWCPLTPLPEYKNLTTYVHGEVNIENILHYNYAQGFNDCLEQIQKGK